LGEWGLATGEITSRFGRSTFPRKWAVAVGDAGGGKGRGGERVGEGSGGHAGEEKKGGGWGGGGGGGGGGGVGGWDGRGGRRAYPLPTQGRLQKERGAQVLNHRILEIRQGGKKSLVEAGKRGSKSLILPLLASGGEGRSTALRSEPEIKAD